jgi:hypothetical protein
MKRRPAGRLRASRLALLFVCGALAATPAADAGTRGSTLALPLITGDERPELMLAQRSIVRAWGPSEDTAYIEVEVPGWRSEGLAAALSAAVPGAGQIYAGESSGWWFALAEVAGWTANRIYLHKAQTERDRSSRFAGDPADSASAWSFARWTAATGQDPSELEQIWVVDRQAFYETIARDPRYLAGWDGDPVVTRGAFSDIRGAARTHYDRASRLGYALWINHLVAALDALRAARLHNLPLQRNLELRLKSSWRDGRPNVMAVLVRRF